MIDSMLFMLLIRESHIIVLCACDACFNLNQIVRKRKIPSERLVCKLLVDTYACISHMPLKVSYLF